MSIFHRTVNTPHLIQHKFFPYLLHKFTKRLLSYRPYMLALQSDQYMRIYYFPQDVIRVLQIIRLLIKMKNRCPCPRRVRNHSNQKTMINSSATVTSTKPLCPRKRNKSVEPAKKRSITPSTKKAKESMILEEKIFDLDEQMQKCRNRQMAIIKKNVALLKYYNCMITLFMIAYTSSQVIASNFFQIQKKGYFFADMIPSQGGINFIGILLKVYATVKNYQFQHKIRRLAINLLKISPSSSDFQRKVEFIARKVVLNNEKSKEIEMSFMNYQLQSFWDKLIDLVLISSQVKFMEDMFQLQPEKLCVKNFQMLIEKYLSCEQFDNEMKQMEDFYSKSTDSGNSHNFSIEFLLIQKICTEDYEQPVHVQPIQQDVKKKKKQCEIY